MVPTLPTLATISRVYGVGMSYFFKEATRHTVSITRKAQLQGTERGPDHVRTTPLNAPNADGPVDTASMGGAHEAGARRPKRLAAQLIEFAPGGTAAISDSIRKSCAVLYVLDGRLQLDSGGMQEFLETGDCAYIDSDMTMAWEARRGNTAAAFWRSFPAPKQRRKDSARACPSRAVADSLCHLVAQLKRIKKVRSVGAVGELSGEITNCW